MSSLVCGLFSQTLSFRYFSEDFQTAWDLGNRMVRGYRFYAIWACPMGSYAWDIQVLCSRNEVATYFSNRTEHLNTSGIASHGTDSFRVKPITPGHPISKISTRLTTFWRSTWKTSSEEKSDGFHKKWLTELWTILMFEMLLCCYTAVGCMERT